MVKEHSMLEDILVNEGGGGFEGPKKASKCFSLEDHSHSSEEGER